MKLEQQVISLDLAKRLKELGVKQESVFWWITRGTYRNLVGYDLAHEKSVKTSGGIIYSAFTTAELGEMLPKGRMMNGWVISYRNSYDLFVCELYHFDSQTSSKSFTESSEADARAKMLIYLLENNLLTPPQAEE